MLEASSPEAATPSIRPGNPMTPSPSRPSVQNQSHTSVSRDHNKQRGQQSRNETTTFSEGTTLNIRSTNRKSESTVATLFGTVGDGSPTAEDEGRRAYTWSTVSCSSGENGMNHSISKLTLSSTATSTPIRTTTSTAANRHILRDITSPRSTSQTLNSNTNAPRQSNHDETSYHLPSSSSSSVSSLLLTPKVEPSSSEETTDERNKENTIKRPAKMQHSRSVSMPSSSSPSLKSSSEVHFEVLCLFSTSLACGMSSSTATRPPVLETTLTAYVENFRNFDFYNQVDCTVRNKNDSVGTTGARFLLDVESDVRGSSFAIQDVMRFLSIQPHQLVLCKRIVNGEAARETIDEIGDDGHDEKAWHYVNMNEVNRIIDACSGLKSLAHKQKGNREILSSSKAFMTTRSVVTTRIGSSEVYIDTTAPIIMKSAFKWLRKRLHNNSKPGHNHDRRSMVVLPSPLSYASRGALLSAWASHGPNIASVKSSAAALAAAYATSREGKAALLKHNGKMNIIITELGDLHCSASLVMLETPIVVQTTSSSSSSSSSSTTTSTTTSLPSLETMSNPLGEEKSVTVTVLSTSGTMNYGIRDAEMHLLRTWLAGCDDKELFNDAILALNSYRYCPQPSEYVPSGEGGGIQCGDWLSPIEDLERKVQEHSLTANEERMLSLRATARATVEAHSLRGNTTTQAFSYATPSLQRKQPSIQQKQKSLQHNRRHANQRSFREFLFSPQGLLCQYLPCSPENQLYHVKHPRRDRSASDVGTSNNVGKRNVIDASNDYGAWHENGGPAVDIPKRLHFYGLAEVVRGCIQSCLSPARLQHASAVGDILPINTSNDANDVNDQNMSKDGDKVDETTRKVYPSIAESLLWVEGDAGVYKRCLTSLIKKEVEAQLGFIEAFRREEESFERRRKIMRERREKALRQLEKEKAAAAASATSSGSSSPTRPTPLPRLPSIAAPSMSILQRWGYALPTSTSYPLFRGGMNIGTRYGFAMDGDDVLTDAESESTNQQRKKEVIREYEYEYSKGTRPTVLLNHDDAWNGAVTLVKRAATMRVYDVSPVTVGMIVVCVVNVGETIDIDWIKDEILLVRGVHEYIHWLVEDQNMNDLKLSMRPAANNTVSISDPFSGAFMAEVPVCPLRVVCGNDENHKHFIDPDNKHSTSNGRYVCITLQNNSFEAILPFECKYEHRKYVDYDANINTSAFREPLSINTDVVGMIELTLFRSSSSATSSSSVVTSPLPTSIGHLSPIKSRLTKEGTASRTGHDQADVHQNIEDAEDGDSEVLMSLAIVDTSHLNISTLSQQQTTTDLRQRVRYDGDESMENSASTPAVTPERFGLITLPTFEPCVLCLSFHEGLLSMTRATSTAALAQFLERGEITAVNVDPIDVSSPILQSFHNLAEKVFQALTPLSAFVMPSSQRNTDLASVDVKRHQRHLDIPRTSLDGVFEASNTPLLSSSTQKDTNGGINAAKKFSIGGRLLGRQIKQLPRSVRMVFMLVLLVLVTVFAFMFISSPVSRSTFDASHETKISTKSLSFENSGNTIMVAHSSDTFKPVLKSGARSSKKQAARGRSIVSTRGSRVSGLNQHGRRAQRARGTNNHPVVSRWVKEKVNAMMDVMIDKLNDAKSYIQ